MANGFRGTLKLDQQSIASGEAVVCTLSYEYKPLSPDDPPPTVEVTASPAFMIAYHPNPLVLASATNGSVDCKVTVKRRSDQKDPPSFCCITFQGLDDLRSGSVTVTL